MNFKALDANDEPVQTEGEVKVTRDYWYEIWLAPDGHEVKGDELKRLQAQNHIWPPPPARPDQKDWQLKFRGYEHDDILTRHLKTDTNGAVGTGFHAGARRILPRCLDQAATAHQPPAPADQCRNDRLGGQ